MSWIQSTENLVRPVTDEGYTQAASARARGQASDIINGLIFDSCHNWAELKGKLQSKFRDTYTTNEYEMTSGQAPLDFHFQLEAAFIETMPIVLGHQRILLTL